MMKQVIDTNVLLVANGKHENISDDCRQECIRRLAAAQMNGIIVLDDLSRIIKEYLNKTHPNEPKGTGDIFLKWLLRNQSNILRVEIVTITETGQNLFEEFPDPALQGEFDPSDRKFAAVANAHPDKPAILQAADCKWLKWWERLALHGVNVIFVCPEDACRFFRNKFPGEPVPPLPGH